MAIIAGSWMAPLTEVPLPEATVCALAGKLRSNKIVMKRQRDRLTMPA